MIMRQTLPIHRFFSTILFLAVTTLTWAYDFAVDGIYYDKNTDGTSVTVTYKTSSDRGYSGSVVIPSTVTYSGKTYSVTSIGSDAFSGCIGLTSITIPESVTSINDYAFYNCSGLTSVTIPNSVTNIGSGAFEYCIGLTSVTIGNGVTSIGEGAFLGTAWYNNQPDGLVYAGKVAYRYKGTMPLGTEIVIKEGTLVIAGSAFWNCSDLTSITIPESVTSISQFAFSGCSGLKSVTIPNSVTNIGYSAFSGCTGLTSVTIGNGVTSIGEGAFLGTAWYNNQPDGLVYAGKVAYRYKGTMPLGTEIVIKEGTLGIAGSAFSGCSGLKSVTIPNSVTNIGYLAFSGCTGLTSVTIPNSVTSIGNSAFYDCSGLKTVTIGSGVTSIGSGAFERCTGLTSVTCHAQKVPSAGSYVFYNVPSTATLYVPAETVEAYKYASQWKDFGRILPITPTAVESLTADEASDTDKDDAIYDLHGHRLQHKPAHGFYIQGGKKYLVK